MLAVKNYSFLKPILYKSKANMTHGIFFGIKSVTALQYELLFHFFKNLNSRKSLKFFIL